KRDVVDDLAIEADDNLVVLAGDLHAIPFARGLGGIFRRRNAGNDAAAIVIRQLGVGSLAAGVVDLHFDAGGNGLSQFADMEVKAAVAALGDLVLEVGVEIGVLFLGPEIGVVALPALLAGPRLQFDDAVLVQRPVALGREVPGQVAAF